MRYKIETLIDEKKILESVKKLGKQITNDYKNSKKIVLVGLLRGSIIFMADLVRKINLECKLDFMLVSSYGNKMETSKDVKIIKDLEDPIEGENVIIVEDILDTGRTLHKVYNLLGLRKPKSLKICTLLDKPERRQTDIKADYVGFEIPDEFVVGYGIDYAQKHRNLPYIGKVLITTK